jgi:multiple antibiotic resistance protein
VIPEVFLSGFAATLFSMLNPLGNVGIFAGMTSDRSESDSRKIAVSCGLTVAVVLLAITWGGTYFLKFFGITISTLQAAGGIVVLIIGLNMLFNKSDHKTSKKEIDDSGNRSSIAVVPLAIPIVSGPGAMAAVLVAAAHHSSFEDKLGMSTVVLGLSLLTTTLFYFARSLTHFLGEAGIGVVTRIMGLVLAAIGMGLLGDGLKSLFPGLA